MLWSLSLPVRILAWKWPFLGHCACQLAGRIALARLQLKRPAGPLPLAPIQWVTVVHRHQLRHGAANGYEAHFHFF